jgi:hypothetical protein
MSLGHCDECSLAARVKDTTRAASSIKGALVRRGGTLFIENASHKLVRVGLAPITPDTIVTFFENNTLQAPFVFGRSCPSPRVIGDKYWTSCAFQHTDGSTGLVVGFAAFLSAWNTPTGMAALADVRLFFAAITAPFSSTVLARSIHPAKWGRVGFDHPQWHVVTVLVRIMRETEGRVQPNYRFWLKSTLLNEHFLLALMWLGQHGSKMFGVERNPYRIGYRGSLEFMLHKSSEDTRGAVMQHVMWILRVVATATPAHSTRSVTRKFLRPGKQQPRVAPELCFTRRFDAAWGLVARVVGRYIELANAEPTPKSDHVLYVNFPIWGFKRDFLKSTIARQAGNTKWNVVVNEAPPPHKADPSGTTKWLVLIGGERNVKMPLTLQQYIDAPHTVVTVDYDIDSPENEAGDIERLLSGNVPSAGSAYSLCPQVSPDGTEIRTGKTRCSSTMRQLKGFVTTVNNAREAKEHLRAMLRDSPPGFTCDTIHLTCGERAQGRRSERINLVGEAPRRGPKSVLMYNGRRFRLYAKWDRALLERGFRIVGRHPEPLIPLEFVEFRRNVSVAQEAKRNKHMVKVFVVHLGEDAAVEDLRRLFLHAFSGTTPTSRKAYHVVVVRYGYKVGQTRSKAYDLW